MPDGAAGRSLRHPGGGAAGGVAPYSHSRSGAPRAPSPGDPSRSLACKPILNDPTLPRRHRFGSISGQALSPPSLPLAGSDAAMSATALVAQLLEVPSRVNEFIDGCSCGRGDKEAVNAIRKELEAKDSAIDRLEQEIRRKDAEKDNLLEMQRDLQAQILQIRQALDAQAFSSEAKLKAATFMQRRTRGNASRKRVVEIRKQRGGASDSPSGEAVAAVGAPAEAPAEAPADGGASARSLGSDDPPMAEPTPDAAIYDSQIDSGVLSNAGLSLQDSTGEFDDGSVDSD